MPSAYLIPVALLFSMNLITQDLPDFNSAIDATKLSSKVLLENIDNTNEYRSNVNIKFLEKEFPSTNSLMGETYYQKDPEHLFIKMSNMRMKVDDFNTWNKGEGHTYFRFSDGVCVLVLHVLAYLEDERLRFDRAYYKDCSE